MEQDFAFRHVTLFPQEEFGLNRVSFRFAPKSRHHIVLRSADQLNSLVGVLEGRYSPVWGHVDKPDKWFVQSDRQLLGDKVISNKAGYYLALGEDRIYLEGRNRSKLGLMDELGAKSIRHFPVYKLRGMDKIRFALLALLFQESGMILISRLPQEELGEKEKEFLLRIMAYSRCSLVLASVRGQESPLWQSCLEAAQATTWQIDQLEQDQNPPGG